MVAMMLTYQPELIAGFEDVEAARNNSFGSLVMFLVSFAVSISYLIKESVFSSGNRMGRSTIEYDGVGSSTGSSIMDEYAMNLDLPPSIHAGYST